MTEMCGLVLDLIEMVMYDGGSGKAKTKNHYKIQLQKGHKGDIMAKIEVVEASDNADYEVVRLVIR